MMGHYNDLFDSPIFVCECCAKILRVFSYEEGEVYCCPYCGRRMIKTKFGLSDFERHMMSANDPYSVKFRNWIYVEYVRRSPYFDRNRMNKRIEDEKREFEEKFSF